MTPDGERTVCERCYSGPATHRVVSLILDMAVCEDCARIAEEINAVHLEGPLAVYGRRFGMMEVLRLQ